MHWKHMETPFIVAAQNLDDPKNIIKKVVRNLTYSTIVH